MVRLRIEGTTRRAVNDDLAFRRRGNRIMPLEKALVPHLGSTTYSLLGKSNMPELCLTNSYSNLKS